MKRFIIFGVALLATALLIAGCPRASQKTTTSSITTSVPIATTSATLSAKLDLEAVWMLPPLNFELENLLGQKVWAIGYYGDAGISGDGLGFLVDNYISLLADEQLSQESFARLDGKLPPGSQSGAEILVFGRVKDYAKTYNTYSLTPTPLISVEEYTILSLPAADISWEEPYAVPLSFPRIIPEVILPAAGTQAGSCDRALVLSGGIDANNNHSRYLDNVIAKYKKLKELGFSDAQIDILYADGSAVDVEGSNVNDAAATKAKFKETLEKYLNEMQASCTLTIFVTDHGTGYNSDQGYKGARPAFSGSEATSGKLYPENTFSIDARQKVYRSTTYTNPHGTVWMFRIDKKTNELRLYQRVGGKWVQRGVDSDGNGFITETEANQDIDGDGIKTDVGLGIADLGDEQHADNVWDTDRDGTNDVRIHWDGTRYVFERFKDGTWREMGRDTNGDFVLNATDGGVDWNLDGDKSDQVGFHEGINLWGREVLWDDEFASLLKALSDKGIHILVEMVQCFGGGFIDNTRDIVEKIVTGSAEDTKHYNRVDAAGKVYAADEMAFLENLKGIDIESWNAAFDKAKEADRQEWISEGSNPATENKHQKWEKPVINSTSTFAFKDGDYDLVLRLPESLKDKVYDLEIITGLQQQRWTSASIRELPYGFKYESIPGGIRIYSEEPFPLTPLLFKLRGVGGGPYLRVQLTDEKHDAIGYILPATTDQLPPVEQALGASLEATAQAVQDAAGGCKGIVNAVLIAEDLTGGKSPIIRVVLTANGIVWYDSGIINSPRVQQAISKEVGCGHVYLLELTVTNSNGQTVSRSLTVNVPASPPPTTTEQPPPTTTTTPPPTENWVQQGVLHISIGASAQSTRDQSGCRSQVSISYSAEITGDINLTVTRVVLKVNAVVWNDSGIINTKSFYNTVQQQTGCGVTLNIEVIVTTSDGQVNTARAQITTPIPPML